jgi:hypothetical protein
VGEASAAYLFGRRPVEVYEEIWSERNELMLQHLIEKVFDDGRKVIVPLPADQTGTGRVDLSSVPRRKSSKIKTN